MHLICHLALQNHVIKVCCNSLKETPQFVTVLPGLVAISFVVVEI